MRTRLLVGSGAALMMAVVGCGGSTASGHDPPVLVPWHTVGNIELGESKARVEQEYGSEGHGYYVLARNQGIV